MKENYDVYQIRMPKGRKDEIKAHAEAHSESVNGFINRAISEAMERDGAYIAEVPRLAGCMADGTTAKEPLGRRNCTDKYAQRRTPPVKFTFCLRLPH